MAETLQCPRCVDETAAAGKPVLEGEFPLQMDPETTAWICERKHVITSAEIEAILTVSEDLTEEATVAKKGGKHAPAKKPERVESAHKRDKIETVKQGEIPEETGSLPEGESGKDALAISELEPISMAAGMEMPNGNLFIGLEVPELYVESVRQMAEESKQTVREWMQQRLDYTLDGEFSTVRSV